MFKHEIAYVDFNGTERKEDFYFHLSLPEITRLEAEVGMPMQQYANEVAASQDMKLMIQFLERIVLSSYGKKTGDGKSFHKSKDLRGDFEYSPAYAELFEQLITDQELTKRFAAGIVDNGKAKKNQVAPQVIQ